MPVPTLRRRLRSAFASLLAATALPALIGSAARADSIDTSMPKSIVVGAPLGFAPSERIDGQRSGRLPASALLPDRPNERWRKHVSGGLEVPPLIDAEGNIYLLLTIPEVVKLSPAGKEIFRTRLGQSAPLAPGTLTSDGTLIVITSTGQAIGISKEGSLRFNTPLGIRGRDADLAPLARTAGGAVIAAGRTLIELSNTGQIEARAQLEDRASGALIEGKGGTLVTTESGGVYLFRPPLAPRKIGSFGGNVRKGAAFDGQRSLIAVVDGRRIVAFDLITATTQVRSSGAGGTLGFDAPVALSPDNLAMATTHGGLLVGLDAQGNEKIRISLEKPPASTAPQPAGTGTPFASFLGISEQKPSPPIVIDHEGRVAFVRAGGRAGIAKPSGEVTIISDKICTSPIAIQPAGERRVLVACRDGALWMYGDDPSSPTP